MRRPVVLSMLAACALASCGGGSSDRKSVENLLDKAFSHGMQSADLKLQAEVDLKGLLADPLQIDARGPFRVNKGKLPSSNIDLQIASGAGGQTISTGVVTTGDRAFVKFQDVYYEEPAAQVRRANQTIGNSDRSRGRPLSELGLNPRSWLADAKDEGDATVAGVETRHVSGTLNVASLMRNLNDFVRKSSSALGGSAGRAAAPRLSSADIRELANAVKNPSFDVYVGKRDGMIRRVSGKLEFEIPKARRKGLGGLKGGSITFSVELRNINGHQRIEAPATARPLSELTNSLGAGGIVAALGGGSKPSTPVSPDQATRPSSSEADAFRNYTKCLDQARPEDTAQLQRCADLLHRP